MAGFPKLHQGEQIERTTSRETNLSEEAGEKHGEERIAVRNDYDLVHVLVR